MIKQIYCYSFVALAAIGMGIQHAEAKEPRNLGLVTQELVYYHDNDDYDKDVRKTTKQAMTYLKKRVTDNEKASHPNKLAVVFDIDETLLSNYKHMKEHNFGGSLTEINRYIAQGDDPAIKPTQQLYQFSKQHRVAIFLITGRDESFRRATAKNLTADKMTGWQQLILKPENDPRTAAEYKTQARKHIVEQGYDIVLNIGDQFSDLRGGYADNRYKLPNPYYLIP